MAENSQSKKNAQAKLEDLFVKATTDFSKWLQATGKPESLFKIFKDLMWSLQFATASHSEAVVTLWFNVMELMRTTRDHSVREWTYEVFVEFTSMRHLIEIVAKHSGFRALQLEFYGLDSSRIVVSSGAKIIIETMLVRLSLCISHRFPEYAAEILLEHGVAEMISNMIKNDDLSKDFRQEVSKRYLKLCDSIKKRVDSSRPAQHQRVNQLRNPHEYHSFLRHQQHHKQSTTKAQQKHAQPQQQLTQNSTAPQAQGYHAARSQAKQIPGEQQMQSFRQQITQIQTRARTALGQHPKQAQQQYREVERQQKNLEKPFAHHLLQAQHQLNVRDQQLQEVYDEEMRVKMMREAERAFLRAWEFESVPERLVWEGQFYRRLRNRGNRVELKALDDETSFNEELDSLLREVDQVCLQANNQEKLDNFGESAQQGIQMGRTGSEQQNCPTGERQNNFEEARSDLEEPVLGPKAEDSGEWIELPQVDSDMDESLQQKRRGPRSKPKKIIQKSPKLASKSSRQDASRNGQLPGQKPSPVQERREVASESKLLKLLQEVPEPRGPWPQEMLEQRDFLLELHAELVRTLEAQQRHHHEILRTAALKYQARLQKLHVLQARAVMAHRAALPQQMPQVQWPLGQIPQQITMHPLPMMAPIQVPNADLTQPPPVLARAQAPPSIRPQEWQLPCEELILLQMEQGRLQLPPELAEKYRNRT